MVLIEMLPHIPFSGVHSLATQKRACELNLLMIFFDMDQSSLSLFVFHLALGDHTVSILVYGFFLIPADKATFLKGIVGLGRILKWPVTLVSSDHHF